MKDSNTDVSKVLTPVLWFFQEVFCCEIVSISDDIMAFMEIESISGNENEVAAWLVSYLASFGYDAEHQSVEGRSNVICNLKSAKLLFCSHIDTVPPFIAPTLKDGVIHGRGACDAKGVIITQIATAVRLTQQGLLSPSDIGFAYVVGEETDHIGAKYLEQLDFSVQMAIVGEPTRNLLCTRGMGLLKLEFTTAGIAGHSAFPESGRSAVHELVSVLDQLEITVGSNPEFDMGTSLYNIGVLTGGTAANVHAPSATATVLYRLAEASSAVISRVDTLLEDVPHTSYSIISLFEPIVLASCDGLETDIARFNSDARYLLSKAESTFLIGPGDIRVAHSEQEHITLESISDGIERMITLITTILKN